MRLSAVIAVILLAGAAPPTAAQGVIGAAGLGYPHGGLSSRVLGSGGAAAELDPASALNPAALSQVATFEVHSQMNVERRTSVVASPSTTSVIPTFPHTGFTLAISSRWVFGLSTSSLLDRSWGNTTEAVISLDGIDVVARDRATSEGGLNDVRLAVAYRLTPRLAVGAGGHFISGENRIELVRTFVDAPEYGVARQRALIDYSGSAYSAGLVYAPTDALVFGASAQIGGSLDASEFGEVVGSGSTPARAGGSVQYSLPGSVFSARVGWSRWSDLDGFSDRAGVTPSTLDARDGMQYGIGADLDGPSMLGAPTVLRVGFARRDLPFRVAGHDVAENRISGGMGIPLAQGRALLDIAVVRAARTGVAGASETGWITSVGLVLRP